MRTRQFKFGPLLLAGVLIGMEFAWYDRNPVSSAQSRAASEPSSKSPTTGRGPPPRLLPAPDFSLKSVQGGEERLRDLKGRVVLLSFLDTQAPPSVAPNRSRSQIVFLKSIKEQFGALGVRVLIVDASALVSGRIPEVGKLINAASDWNLKDVSLLADRNSSTARAYGVSKLPTTFLIGAEGKIRERWDGFATAAQLGFAVQSALGQGEINASSEGARPACEETPAQAKFAGLPRARPLSEHIWVVDGGETWPTGRPWPVKWLVLGAGRDLQIRVIAKGREDSRKVLVDAPMSPLSPEESKRLQPDSAAAENAYLLSAPVVVPFQGCIELQATVSRDGVKAAAYRGYGTVPVF